MEELWIYPVEWIILPACQGSPFPEEWTSELLGRSSRVLGLMKGRKIGTVMQHTGWTFLARQQVHYPNFKGVARARVVRTWREDGFRNAKVEILGQGIPSRRTISGSYEKALLARSSGKLAFGLWRRVQ